MMRQVQAADGRTWTVRREMNWTSPAVGEDFEHDVAPGYLPAVILGLVLALLVVVLIAWTPDEVRIPTIVVIVVVAVVAFIPLRWVLRRPFTVVAEVPEDEFMERPSERWVGTVRGVMGATREMRKAARNIEVRSEPDIEGHLQPVE